MAVLSLLVGVVSYKEFETSPVLLSSGSGLVLLEDSSSSCKLLSTVYVTPLANLPFLRVARFSTFSVANLIFCAFAASICWEMSAPGFSTNLSKIEGYFWCFEGSNGFKLAVFVASCYTSTTDERSGLLSLATGKGFMNGFYLVSDLTLYVFCS